MARPDTLDGLLDSALTEGFEAEAADAWPTMPARYRVEGEIARGGVGRILAAHDLHLGRPVAIKVLRPEHRADQVLRHRLELEARVGSSIEHPAIVSVHELDRTPDGERFVVFERLAGRTLRALLDEHTPGTELRRFVEVLLQVARGMGHAHAHGVVHRDLKPANVMVGPLGQTWIMDWGLARWTVADAPAARDEPRPSRSTPATDEGPTSIDRTSTEAVLGTPPYMAPEQARGENDTVDARADVFALGAMLCEMLTGAPPFDAADAAQARRRAAAADLSPAFARLRGCDAPAELVACALGCLAPDAADRPADALQVAQLLERYLLEVDRRLRDAELGRTAAEARAAAERRARRRVTAVGAVAVVATLTASAGLLLWLDARDAARTRQTHTFERDLDTAQARWRVAASREGYDDALWGIARTAAAAAVESARGVGIGQLSRAREVAAAIDAATTATDAEARTRARATTLRAELEDRMLAWLTSSQPVSHDYSDTFARFGVDVFGGNRGEVDRVLRTSGAPVEVAAAFALWSGGDHGLAATERARLLALADALDPDAVRVAVRRAWAADDVPALRAQLDRGVFEPATVTLLVQSLETPAMDAPDLTARIERLVDAALLAHPEATLLHLHKARLLSRASRPGGTAPLEARAYLAAAAAALPGRERILAAIARTFEAAGESEQALEFAEGHLRDRPTAPRLLLAAGRLRAARGDHERALEYFRRRLAVEDEPATHGMLGLSLLALGRLDDARRHIEISTAAATSLVWRVGGMRNLASVAVRQRRFDQALEILDRSLASLGRGTAHRRLRAAVLSDRADILITLEKLVEATAAAEQAVELAKDDVRSRTILALAYLRDQKPARARAHIVYATAPERRIAPAWRFPAWRLRASIHQRLGQTREALAAFRRCAALDFDRIATEECTVYANLANRAGAFREALDVTTRVLGRAPDQPVAQYVQGVALAGLGRHAEAVEAFDRALATQEPLHASWPPRIRARREKSRMWPRVEAAFDRLIAAEQVAATSDPVTLEILGDLARQRAMHRAATACYEALLESKAAAASTDEAATRTKAAECRLRRAATEGEDRHEHRRAALAHLQARVEQATPAELDGWFEAPWLAPLRSPASLQLLSAAERDAWTRLWKRVAMRHPGREWP